MAGLKRGSGFPATVAVVASVLLFVVSVCLYAGGTSGSAGARIGVAMMLGAAAVAVGALFGLLFGVPRVRAPRDETRDPAAAAPDAREAGGASAFGMNTNLGEVSDWLTKILVGVGLTQITKIGPAFAALSAAAGEPFGDSRTGQVFAGAIILFLTVFGFIAGWLCSVLILPTELSLAIEKRATESAVKEVERKADAVVDTALDYERSALDALQAALDPIRLQRGRGAGDHDAMFKVGRTTSVVEVRYRTKWLGRDHVIDLASRAPATSRLIVIAPGFSPAAREWVRDNAERVTAVTWRGPGDSEAFATLGTEVA